MTSLGYGKRVGIWVQGCSIQCPGCVSRDTWAFREDMAIDVELFIASIEHWLIKADGVTISGGEPFDQPEALASLTEMLRQYHPGDILVYSGYSLEWLLAQHAAILKQIDVLISEPYRPEAGAALTLRGSDNQRITLLSTLARERYPQDIDRRAWDPTRNLDVMVDGETVWMAGIPRDGEMARLKRHLAGEGLDCGSSDQPHIAVRA